MWNTSEPGPAAPAPPRVRRTLGVHPNYLDVMCCLVLVFLMTSLLAQASRQAREQKLPPIVLPQLPQGLETTNESAAFIVTVKPGPIYFAGDKPVSLAALADALRRAHPSEVEVRADAASTYLHVMNAIEACREAGVAQVALTYEVKE
jgi:biopolymer transport protein ExbD